MTKNSKLVLDIINSSNEHLTAEQIFFKAKELSPKIVLSTVYNNLNRLTEQGEIRRISLEGCPDRYDNKSKHDHLVCKCCGRLTDVFLNDLTAVIEKETGKSILSYDLKISYICSDCQNADS